MKLTHIDIEKYGVWSELLLPIAASGLTVLYGPNEAGKSTLLKYIRGMLYGFPAAANDRPFGLRKGFVSHLPWSGSVSVQHAGSPYQIRRSATSDNHRLLSVHAPTDRQPHHGEATQITERYFPPEENERLLRHMHSGIGEKLFQQLYAIGLTDLQELATWDDETIANHIYSLTLGPVGKTLLHANESLKKAKASLVQPKHGSRATVHLDAYRDSPRGGKIERLLKHYTELSDRLDEQNQKVQRYREIVAESELLQDHLVEMKSRRAGLDSQLRGHQFMDRIWGPWTTVQKLRREWKQIPRVKGFPENGLQKLIGVEQELESARRCRDSIRAEIDRFRGELKSCSTSRRLSHVANAVHRLQQLKPRIETISTNLPDRQRELGERAQRLQTQLRELDGEWTTERLCGSGAVIDSAGRLHETADLYRRAARRRNHLRQRIQRQLQRLRREKVRWKERLPSSEELSPAQGLKQARGRQQLTEELGDVMRSIQSLTEQQRWTVQRLSQESQMTELPAWGRWAVTSFTAFGAILFVAGLLTGWWQSALAGSIFCLLALASASVGHAVRSHFAATTTGSQDAILEEHVKIKTALTQLRQRQNELCDELSLPVLDDEREESVVLTGGETEKAPLLLTIESTAVSSDDDGESDFADPEIDTWELLRESAREVGDWEAFAEWHQNWLAQRRGLSELRTRFQERQREIAESRKAWCDALTTAGLPETLNVSEGLAGYHRLVAAAGSACEWKSLNDSVNKDRQMLAAFQQQTARIQQKINNAPSETVPTIIESLRLVDNWNDELRQMKTHRRERRRLLKEIRLRRQEEAEYQQLMHEYQMQASALMVQGGAANRDEFEKRANWSRRRTELRTLIGDAKRTLAEAARTEPDLAVVESDLEQFDPEENAEHLQTVQHELADLDDDLHIAYEELGQLKQEIKTLTADRTSAGLLREREQVLAQLREACIDWCALDWARQSLERVQEQYEQTSQPEALTFASNYLQQLTDGRYRRIWTPLGERRLYVDDAHEQNWTVEQLSNGTREQLFLSVRLALVSQLAKQGVELPIVLDDVLVNFDEHRTQAAIRLLADYAASGQQVILLTCHAHIAAAFDRIGVPSVHPQSSQPMLWERQAG
ncbi:MAG: AAA family ATPase [Planctomycetaceae bacterium]